MMQQLPIMANQHRQQRNIGIIREQVLQIRCHFCHQTNGVKGTNFTDTLILLLLMSNVSQFKLLQGYSTTLRYVRVMADWLAGD